MEDGHVSASKLFDSTNDKSVCYPLNATFFSSSSLRRSMSGEHQYDSSAHKKRIVVCVFFLFFSLETGPISADHSTLART